MQPTSEKVMFQQKIGKWRRSCSSFSKCIRISESIVFHPWPVAFCTFHISIFMRQPDHSLIKFSIVKFMLMLWYLNRYHHIHHLSLFSIWKIRLSVEHTSKLRNFSVWPYQNGKVFCVLESYSKRIEKSHIIHKIEKPLQKKNWSSIYGSCRLCINHYEIGGKVQYWVDEQLCPVGG